MGPEKQALDTRVETALTEGRTIDLGIPAKQCLMENKMDPCAIVIVGASGDLTGRKILPALFNLFINGGLPDPFLIVGCSRTQMSDQAFRDKMKDAVMQFQDLDNSKWPEFARCLYYRSIDYHNLESFTELAEFLRDLDERFKTNGNRIFYLAIPPTLYRPVSELIGRAGLAEEGEQNNGWSRIVVEKPFGRDLETAIDLDRSIHEHFQEHQIFRIDHYLAKETVQNVLMFRFANSIFEPIWNRRYIEYVRITAAESIGVEHRAGYYEQTGVLRDMFQNHMMQLLAMTAMDPPSLFEADQVRDEKIRVFRSLRPFPVDKLNDYLILGQYGPGEINGEKVPGYREEPEVSSDSLIPTFAMMKIFLDNWRWQGVPFFLTSGKRLAEKLTEIVIQFKEVPHSMFRQTLDEHITANRLILRIYPDEKIILTFQTKNPGAKVCLRSVTMNFNYLQNYTGPVMEAYEKVLIDCMSGDQMLFWRQDGVELCWSFLTPILVECETCGDRAEMLYPYTGGTWGPEPFHKLWQSQMTEPG
ncbi:MAG: glucose-6-phosphate dehydrogenase [Deltaproteobacteria bacterium]|nr:glucose-6-phosphate dehydrogenase [Deltaproteobacteria bacterium]MBW2052397.1 glucose-6-phosphate dehydrogenase [Deltaproteobacteria bacterium]MBW2141469.1 glucose-6-phosphate dehydrogenase [Deltaproteobacteria bacterium]MBW2323112.1 glucose-6-phosphate dehydrogenase [Deltaproteobacteria bacterium]